MSLNGALAGLVAITAEPLMPSFGMAAIIGAIGAIIMYGVAKGLEKVKIDDVVGAVPVHLGAGIWGTLAVAITNTETTFLIQLAGIAAIGAFVTVTSFVLWAAMKYTIGIRLHWSKEDIGGDLAELGAPAYNLGALPS